MTTGRSDPAPAPVWTPPPARAAASNLARFAAALGHGDYGSLHAWSVADPGRFWAAVWDELGVVGTRGGRTIEPADEMWRTRFLPDATLNVAENLLRFRGPEPALIFQGEDPTVTRTVSSIR